MWEQIDIWYQVKVMLNRLFGITDWVKFSLTEQIWIV